MSGNLRYGGRILNGNLAYGADDTAESPSAEGGACNAKPHVCPPLSAALRAKVETRIAVLTDKTEVPAWCIQYADALRWLLREADALAEKGGKAK